MAMIDHIKKLLNRYYLSTVFDPSFSFYKAKKQYIAYNKLEATRKLKESKRKKGKREPRKSKKRRVKETVNFIEHRSVAVSNNQAQSESQPLGNEDSVDEDFLINNFYPWLEEIHFDNLYHERLVELMSIYGDENEPIYFNSIIIPDANQQLITNYFSKK